MAAKIEHFYQNIRGHFTFPEFYRWLVEQLPDNKVTPLRGVEIGVLAGQSAAFLGIEIINSNKFCKLDLVDTCAKEEFLPNLEPIKSVIGAVHDKIYSYDAAAFYEDASLDFVFIDADHTYDFVKKDIAAWLPKIKPGGIIAGHDFNLQYPGVIQAVIESLPHFEVMRCSHWEPAPPEQKDWYFPVWYERVK